MGMIIAGRAWFWGIFPLMSTWFIPQGAIKAVAAFALIFAAPAWAAGGYIYEATGIVSAGEGKNATHAVSKNDLIPSDTVVNTGDKSYAVLKFEDGQVATMQANTAIYVKEYRYDSANAENGNIILSGFTGGMRFITGLIGQRNHKTFRLSTPNATISTSGTEFLVATNNNTLYSQVVSGSISMINEAGVAVFNTGQTILVASPNTLPIAIPSAALPPGIFSQLDAIPTPPATPASLPEVSSTKIKSATIVNATGATTGSSAAALSAANTSPTFVTSATAKVSDNTPVQAYTVANVLCDFCTSSPDKIATHIETPASADVPVTGEPSLFGKHNLTPTGANTGEICAFCHTPQGAENNVTAPRWNRTLTTLSSYRAFSSLGSAVQEATGSISMACLSCHDGSQAPNIVINTPDLQLDAGDVQVNIGNALRNHHPVGIQYAGGGQNQNAPDIPPNPIAAFDRLADSNKFAGENKFGGFYSRSRAPRFFNRRDIDAFSDVLPISKEGDFASLRGGFNKSTYSGTGNGTVWWVKTPGSQKNGRQKTDLYLFSRTDTIDSIPSESVLNRPYVECATCHDPHSTNSTFLRPVGGNARSQICLTCHNK